MEEVTDNNHHDEMDPSGTRKVWIAAVGWSVLGAGVVGAALWPWSALFRHSWEPARLPLGLSSLMLLAATLWVLILRRRVEVQTAALKSWSETANAMGELSTALEQASTERRFELVTPVAASEHVAPLVAGCRERAGKEAEARIRHLALMDELTGLPNRRLLWDRLSQSLARARREQRTIALLSIDLDSFKLVNDSFGHAVGDALLSQVAQRLRSRFRRSDTLARIGGDEFTLILDHIQRSAEAEIAANSLQELLKRPFEIEGHSIRITASIGISLFPDHGQESGQLLQQADCAMYAAKRNGKNRIVQFGDGLGHAARERLMLEADLRRAIADEQIFIHYQPEFDLATQSIVRFEALARWAHPKLGLIPPLNFIPVAEESGLIIPLGSWIMERACTDALVWQGQANRPIQVAVNVSSVQFARDSFSDEVEDILRRTGLSPSLLQIELTESATLTRLDHAAEMMRRMKSMGVSVAIDDFGTGYSCLSYLPKLSFDALKIDRSFVKELLVRPEMGPFVQSILTLAHNLHMKVIVEGIETREQLDLIRALGTNEAQGYLLGRPSPNPVEQLRRGWNTAELARDNPRHDLEAVS
jgi:diguanylate cyclase (GGDEF)-like protein